MDVMYNVLQFLLEKTLFSQALQCNVTVVLTEANNSPTSSSRLGIIGSLSMACFDIQEAWKKKSNTGSGSQSYFKNPKEKDRLLWLKLHSKRVDLIYQKKINNQDLNNDV